MIECKLIDAKYDRIRAKLLHAQSCELFNAGCDLTIEQVASITGRTHKTIANAVSNGDLRATRNLRGKTVIASIEVSNRYTVKG